MADLHISERLTIPDREIEVSFARASGPGGQHVNRTESKVTLRWAPHQSSAVAALSEPLRQRLFERLTPVLSSAGDLVVSSARTRDQHRNREDAQQKFAEIVATALAPPPKPRRKTRPTRASVERRLDAKRRTARRKRARKPGSVEE